MTLITSLLFTVTVLTACGRTASTETTMTKLPPERAKLAEYITDLRDEHVNMPKIPLDFDKWRYINTTPDELPAAMKGKVVLIDIWDYTCVNCIRTLPYISQWAEKYKDLGLIIVGVHTPEFEFEKQQGNLEKAVASFNLTYPIIADNEYKIWNSLANRYWPAKYIFDAKGKLRATHFGEGAYQEYEAFIQKMLLERDSTIALPELTPLIRDTDKPGAVCYRPTPETYLGFHRNKLGNGDGYPLRKSHEFTLPEELDEHELYLNGPWKIDKEFAAPAGSTDASMTIRYEAKEVNLVIKPADGSSFVVLAEQDGNPIPKQDRGTDIIERDGKTYINVLEPKMYNIITNSKYGGHRLTLTSNDPSFAAYAFTFTTECKTDQQ